MIEDKKAEPASINECRPMRMSAQAVIAEKIKRLQREIDALETILLSIPWKMLSQEKEETLWNYFQTHR